MIQFLLPGRPSEISRRDICVVRPSPLAAPASTLVTFSTLWLAEEPPVPSSSRLKKYWDAEAGAAASWSPTSKLLPVPYSSCTCDCSVPWLILASGRVVMGCPWKLPPQGVVIGAGVPLTDGTIPSPSPLAAMRSKRHMLPCRSPA